MLYIPELVIIYFKKFKKEAVTHCYFLLCVNILTGRDKSLKGHTNTNAIQHNSDKLTNAF